MPDWLLFVLVFAVCVVIAALLASIGEPTTAELARTWAARDRYEQEIFEQRLKRAEENRK